MKTRLLLFAFMLMGGIISAGCNSQKTYRPDAKIITALNNKYPKAEKIEWEVKQGYYVADFYDQGLKNEAWFDEAGKWMMTETDLKYKNLPQAVQDNFEKSMYKSWNKDDIEKIERAGMKTVYIIEAKKEGQKTNLYYGENGQFVKAMHTQDNVAGFLPVNSVLRDKIKQKYPDATVIEIDHDNGKQEIDILDNGKSKEVIFDGDNWISTSWEISKAEVPSMVMNAFRKSDYGKYRIDDIHFYETPERSFYYFDLEHGDNDVHLAIEPNGEIWKNGK